MVKLGSPFVQYDSANNGTIVKIDPIPATPVKSKSSFTFISSGGSIRDYLRRKIFKATKEEVSYLLKSTSNLNLAGVFSSKSSTPSSKGKVSSSSKKCNQVVKSSPIVNNDCEATRNELKSNDDIKQPKIIMDVEGTGGQTEGINPCSVNTIESSNEVLEESVSEIKPCRRFSMIRLSKRKEKKARFAEDLTQSLPASASCSTSVTSTPQPQGHKGLPKIVKWAKKMRKCKSKPCDQLTIGKVSNGQSGGDVKKDEEKKEPVKWSKRVRKFAIRTCRYLGYGAQMVSPMTPYTDIPMPVTYDGRYNVYPPYYGNDPYYSYSSCGSIYGYKMSHYGLTY